jgi:hypothetical protein
MESFLSPADIASLRNDVGDAWETGRQLQEGGTVIVFAYVDPITQEREYTDPQTVTIIFPQGDTKVMQDATGEEVSVDAYLKHPEPFDCRRGYTFGYGPEGEERRGEILMVYPAKLGIVRAVAHLSV